MNIKKHYFILFILLLNFLIGFGQEEIQEYTPQIAPPSPSAFQFAKYGNINLNGNSGGFNYTVPIYTIEYNDINIPVSANYFSNGVQVDELSGILGTDWNLTAGGIVTRIMKGIPDDIAHERWYEWNPELNENDFNLSKLISIAKGEGNYDAEPDWFSFNVNGVSGEFYLDEDLIPHVNSNQYFKIDFQRYQSTRGYGKRSAFIITDDRGYKYVFGGEEHENDKDLYLEANRSYRDCFVGPDDKYYSSWYLKEIISPSNNKVTFTYSDNNLKYYAQASYNLNYYPTCVENIGFNSLAYNYKYSECRYYNDMQSKVLSKITFGNNQMKFKYNTNRNDGGGKALEQIEIFTKENSNPIKTISFTYDEVQNRNTTTDSKLQNTTSLLYRLFLKKISFYNHTQDIGENFSFDYYNKDQLPKRLSFSKDKYGFNNGTNNIKPFSKKLKESEIKNIMIHAGGINYATANLEVNPNKVYFGMLKKIIYPTGGYSNIIYEANSTLKNEKKIIYKNEYIDLKKECNEPTKTESFSFISNGSPIILDGALVTLDEIHNNGTCQVQPDSAHDKYRINIYKDGVMIFTKKMNYGESLNPSNPFTSCVDSIDNYFDEPICTQEGSEYQIAITALSKPFNPAEGSVSFRYNGEEITEEVLKYGAGVRVKEISDYDGSSQYNKRTFYYNELKNYPSLKSSLSNIIEPTYWETLPMPVYCHNNKNNSNDFHGKYPKFSITASSITQLFETRASTINYSAITELLDSKKYGAIERKYFEVIDDLPAHILNNPIYNTPLSNSQSSLYSNKLKEEVFYNSNGLKVKKRIFKYNELYKGNIPALTARKNLDILNVMLPNNFEKITHSASNYFNFFGVLKLKKIEKKEYLATNSIKTEENYIYGDSPYFQLKEKAISNSFDEVLKTFYKYPFDFPTNSKMQTLVAQNRIADPVEIQEKNEGTITKTSKMVYDATSQTSGLLLPVKTQIGKGDINSLEDRISFDNYDSKGNILQVSKADNGSTKTSYIWDAEGIYPLAKITNETHHSIPTNLINNIHTASQNNNETSLKNALEALRNHYKNKEVLVETYTYHPLFGMTSATDPSGLSTYYEYDGFGRLKTIKNNNKAKKESYSYQYDSNGIDNFVRTRTYKSLLGNKYIDNTIYLDGLGRPVQEIAHAQSGQGNDLITSIEYDGFGREFKKYLPYDRGNTSLSKDNDALNNALSFYDSPNFQNTNNPYVESLFEDSPLERVLKEAAPGDDWKMDSGRETEYEYDTNKDEEVRYFKVNNPTSSSMPTLKESSEIYYASGQLYKTITKDENHQGITKVGTTEEFKNKLGQVILKRQWEAKIFSIQGKIQGDARALDTYYVYDDYGNLSFVLPPKLSEKIAAGNTNYNQLIDKLGYRYKYDHRNRMIQKKLPGRQIEYTAYDPSDRVIAVGPVSSPFDNESENGILHTRYDAFDRVVHTSWSPVTSFDETARKNIENSISNTISEKLLSTPINSDGLKIHYSSQVAPPAGKNHYISSSLYDKYPSWIGNIPDQILNQNVFYDDNMPPKGLETATYNRVLESKSSTNATHSYFLYDNEKRLLREHSQNHLGGYTQTDNKYNFIGEILKTETRHKRTDADTELKIEEDFSYTEQNRLKKHTHQINSAAKEMIVFHEYDALGQLSAKKVGGENEDQFLQQVDYKYNIRGWLTDINDTSSLASKNQPQDLFAFHINYNLINNAHPSVRPLYNGNISQVYWRTSSDNILRSYDYTYDPLNRLLDAYYRIPNSSVQDSYNEHLTYDSNGNILTLKRNGKEETEQQVFMIDDLDYEYEGNQLLNVTDDTNYSEGFDDGNKHQQTNLNDYEYDDYGNMIKDRNKGITEITYNHLNLPKKIKFGTAGTIEYLYDAEGNKLQKKVTEGSANKTVDYLDGFQYENGNLEFFPTAEGYVKATEIEAEEYAFNYVYNYTDHLGNIRLRYTKDPEDENKVRILEEDHYYSFGMKHQGYNNEHEIIVPPFTPMPLYPTVIVPITPDQEDSYQYKYQGQERQDELGLNWYSYKYRNYDPAIGRFMVIDPLTEEYHTWSSYVFSGNRVIDARELEGLEPHSVHKTLDDAATNFGEQYNGISIRSGREVGTIFYSMTGSNEDVIYSYSTPTLGTAGFVNPQDAEPIPEEAVQVGDGHTHGNDSNNEEILEKMGVKNAYQYGDNFPTTEGGGLG